MAKHKGQNHDEEEELESYLTNDLNFEVFNHFTTNKQNPLPFFRLLYAQYEFVKTNKARPVRVIKSLNELELQDNQRATLLLYLACLAKNESEQQQDAQLGICHKLIAEEFSRVSYRNRIRLESWQSRHIITPGVKRLSRNKPDCNFGPGKYDFTEVKQLSEKLPDYKAKIKYLVEIKTEYLQDEEIEQAYYPDFIPKCNLEIEKLEKLAALEQASKGQNASQDEKEKRSKGGTQYQNLLALYYLLHYLRAKDNNTKKAGFASFLTGFSAKAIRQQWSNIHQKKDNNGEEWQKDMKIVRDFFQELGLPDELIKQIDNDLNF